MECWFASCTSVCSVMAAAVPRIQGCRENQESEDWIGGAAFVVVEVMATTSAAATGCTRDGTTLEEVEMAVAGDVGVCGPPPVGRSNRSADAADGGDGGGICADRCVVRSGLFSAALFANDSTRVVGAS